MALGKAAKLPDGKNYADLGEFLSDLMNKPLRVHLVHDTYNNTERESVSYINPTDSPQVRHVMKKKDDVNAYAAPQASYAAPASNNYGAVPDDDDIPF